MTKLEEYLIRLLEELALHESVICIPCAHHGVTRDASSYLLLKSGHKAPVCSPCATREIGYGNADGVSPVDQPYVTTRIREELRLLPLISPPPVPPGKPHELVDGVKRPDQSADDLAPPTGEQSADDSAKPAARRS